MLVGLWQPSSSRDARNSRGAAFASPGQEQANGLHEHASGMPTAKAKVGSGFLLVENVLGGGVNLGSEIT